MGSTPYLVMPSTGTSYLGISSSRFTPSAIAIDSPPAPTMPTVAHKHAHHLHSIPPRNKSTKSLILDHLLWLHALARIAHVGAELGMSVIRDDGDEDNSFYSVKGAMLVDALHYGISGIGKPALRVEKTRVDLVRGRALKARAEGLERVLAAMIDGQRDNGPLPDSVRFRLTLGAMINDVFASQPPSYPPPTDPTRAQRPSSSIPEALLPLSRPHATPPDRSSTLLPSFSSLTSSKAASTFNAHTWSQPLGSTSTPNESGSTHSLTRQTNVRSKELYASGIDGDPVSQPQLPRCYRHLRQECKSCSTPTTSATTIGAGLSRSSDGRPFRRHPDYQAPDADLKSRVLEIIPHFLALSALVCTEITKEEQRRRKIEEEDENNDDASLSIDEDEDVNRSSTSLASSITTSTSGTQHHSSNGHRGRNSLASLPVEVTEEPKSRKLSLPFPFNRSSATNDGRSPLSPLSKASKSSSKKSKAPSPVARPTREWYALLAGLLTRALLEGYLLRNWRGTSAAEVVLNIGPTDEPDKKSRKLKKPQTKSIFSRKTQDEPATATASTSVTTPEESTSTPFLNPDGMPNLTEASSVLFGRTALGKEGKPDAGSEVFLDEYVKEMEKRLIEFLDVSPQARDLAAHLDTLSERYPAEPVEAGVLRFSEAIAVWRGKPELEEYKRGADTMQSPIRSSPYIHTRDHVVHSRSTSIQSSTSMVYQSPEIPRHQALSGHMSAQDGGHGTDNTPIRSRSSASPAPSISIASLIHPPPSPSGYDSAASDSFSVLPIPPRPPKSLIDYFFTIEDPTSNSNTQSRTRSASEMDVVLPPISTVLQQDPVAKSRNPLDRWNPFSLGSKRPRDPVRDVILESDRASKKSLTIASGKFNT